MPAKRPQSRAGKMRHTEKKTNRRQRSVSQKSVSHSQPSPQSRSFSQAVTNPQASKEHPPSSSENKTKLTGCRRIGGTLCATTVKAVENTLKHLTTTGDSLEIRRKYKKTGNTSRWWFVVHANENVLLKLEAEWTNVKLNTNWKLEHCYMATNCETPPFLDDN